MGAIRLLGGILAGGAVLMALGSVGCGRAFRYSKPGASYGEYIKDRDGCLRENMVTEASASGAAYGTAASFGSSVHQCLQCGLYVSCMSLKDWQADPNGYAPPEGGRVRCCPGSQ